MQSTENSVWSMEDMQYLSCYYYNYYLQQQQKLCIKIMPKFQQCQLYFEINSKERLY